MLKPRSPPEVKYTVYLQIKGEKNSTVILKFMSSSSIPKNNIKRGRAVIATLVATQVDIIFLTNYDQRQYHSPAFADRLPSRFPRLWDCFSRPGASPAWRGLDFRSTRTGRLTLRGLFHQTMYITKFMAAHASVTISRWLTGKCPMACAMHCNTNHDIWSPIRDLQSWSLFPLAWISALVGMVNDL